MHIVQEHFGICQHPDCDWRMFIICALNTKTSSVLNALIHVRVKSHRQLETGRKGCWTPLEKLGIMSLSIQLAVLTWTRQESEHSSLCLTNQMARKDKIEDWTYALHMRNDLQRANESTQHPVHKCLPSIYWLILVMHQQSIRFSTARRHFFGRSPSFICRSLRAQLLWTVLTRSILHPGRD
jgi:hypothetical protein